MRPALRRCIDASAVGATLLLLSFAAWAADSAAPVTPACIGVVDFLPLPSSPDAGRATADLAAMALRDRGATAVLGREEIASYLKVRQIVMPKARDPLTVAAVGRALGAGSVLDGALVEYHDRSQSPRGEASVAVSLSLVDTASRLTVWRGYGRASSRARREPMSSLADKAVRSALSSLSFSGDVGPSCPALSIAPLAATPEPSAGTVAVAAPPAGTSRTYSSKGQTVSVDISAPRTVQFDSAANTLSAAAKTLVKEVAEVLKANPDLTVVLEGHSPKDAGQTEEQAINRALARAEAVAAALKAEKVEGTRLLAKSLGDSAQVGPNDTAAGRKANRRVEIKFVTGAP